MKRKYLLLILIPVMLIIAYYASNYMSFIGKYGTHRIGNMDQSYSYMSSGGGFSMTIPVAWTPHKVHSAPDNMQYLTETMGTSNPRAFIDISVFRNNQIAATELLLYMGEFRKGSAQLSTIESKEMISGNYEGFLIEYTYLEHEIIGDYTNHCYDWIIPDNGGYDFTFCADNKLWEYAYPMYQQMIQSIEISSD